jgi:hypothetical protein
MCGREMSYAWGKGECGSIESRPARIGSRKHLARLLAACALCCAAEAANSTSAGAQARETAAPASDYDTLIQQASDAYRAKHFEQARDLFEQAHVLQPSARTLRGLGIAAFALNRYSQARPELEASLVDSRKPLPRDQRREVSDILSWMKQSLGTLRLELTPPHALALIDDQATTPGTNLLELGEHQLLVRATGYATREQPFLLERDHPLTLRVDLQRDAAPVASVPAPSLSRPITTEPQRDSSASESRSVFGRWWFWTIAGVVIATGVVTVWAVTHEPAARGLPPGNRLSTP